MPKATVAIPLYNKAPHIGHAIRSVLSQTEPDFEVIVVDDGSTDDGAAVVSALQSSDPRLKLFRQENQGVSAARNRGIAETSSDFIAFLDADDEWEPDHLETLLRLREKFPQAGAYATAYVFVRPDGKTTPPNFAGIPVFPWEGLFTDYFESASLGDPPVSSSSVGISLDIFHKVGFFKIGEKTGEDLDMWGRIALAYPIAFSWKGIAYYREDSTGRACMLNPVDKDLPFVTTVKERLKHGEVPFSAIKYACELYHQRVFSLLARGKRYEALKVLLSIDFRSCRKYTFFRSLCWVILPTKLARLLGVFRRKLEHLVGHKF